MHVPADVREQQRTAAKNIKKRKRQDKTNILSSRQGKQFGLEGGVIEADPAVSRFSRVAKDVVPVLVRRHNHGIDREW